MKIINKQELKSIAYYNNTLYSHYGESLLEEDFEPIPIDPNYFSSDLQLRKDYAATLVQNGEWASADMVRTLGYFGTYNGTIVTYVMHYQDNPRQADSIEIIDGVPIIYTSSLRLTVYVPAEPLEMPKRDNTPLVDADRGFYTLTRAYELGILTDEDIHSIAYHYSHRFIYSMRVDNCYTDQVSPVMYPSFITEEKKAEIKEDGFESLKTIQDELGYYLSSINSVSMYLGTYHSAIVSGVFYTVGDSGSHSESETVAGITFDYPSAYFRILVWVD